MPTETEQTISDANPDGSKSEEEIKDVEGKTEEEVVEDPNAAYLPPDETGSEQPDAGDESGEPVPGDEELPPAGDDDVAGEPIAKTAFQLREERRKRKAAEDELAFYKNRDADPGVQKPDYPDRGNFESDTEYSAAVAKYTEDLIDYKAAVTSSQNAGVHASRQRSDDADTLEQGFLKAANDSLEKYPDFFEKVGKTDWNGPLSEATFRATNKAEIAYHLAHNHDLRNKLLSSSSPIEVATEITRLDARFTASLKNKKRSTTPAPITPVGGQTPVGGLSKPIAEMTAQEVYDARAAGLIKDTD